MNSQRQSQNSKNKSRYNLGNSFLQLLDSKRFKKYFKLIFLIIFCTIELIEIAINILKNKEFSELQNDLIVFLIILIISIVMIPLISYDIINLSLEGVLFCCLLGCLFESYLFNQQKTLRLCAFFIFSQRTINDMQKVRGNKVALFILVLYPLLRFSIEKISNISLIFQHLLLLIANSLFSVVKCQNNDRLQQKNPNIIVQDGIKKHNFTLHQQTNQSNVTYNGQDIYGIPSDPQHINQTKFDQSSILQIYNNLNKNNISMLNDDDPPHFNSFHTSKIKQPQETKNLNNFQSGRDVSSDKSNLQNLTFQNMQFKQDSEFYEQSQKKYIMDWIQSQISTGIILLDKNKKLIYSNKPLKKIVNKSKIYGNIQELTYFLSLRLQMIQKYKKQFHEKFGENINCKGNQNKNQIKHQEKQANTKFNQLLQEQKQQRENENIKNSKGKSKLDQNGTAIYNQYQSNKNIQTNGQNNQQSNQKQYRKITTVEVLSNNSQTDTLFQSKNIQNQSENSNPKIQFSPQKMQQSQTKQRNQNNSASKCNQDKFSGISIINSMIVQNQFFSPKLIQCILPNNLNKIFTQDNLQIDDIIDFLLKYSFSLQYQKMNTDNKIQTEQSEDNDSYNSYNKQNKQRNIQKIQNIVQQTFAEINQQVEDSDVLDNQMQNHIKKDKNSSVQSSMKIHNTSQNTFKQGEDVLSEKNNKLKSKEHRKKLYDYFISNNYLHITVQQEENDLSLEEKTIFQIKLSVFQQQDLGEHKFILIEISDISKLIKQIDHENLDCYKNKILSSVSHELRTPLNCSIQMLEMLSQSDEISPIIKQIFIQPSLNSNLLLLNIINDILDLAQINYGKFTMLFSSFELNQICTECINLISMQALQKKIEIELDLDPSIPQNIHSDPNRIRQVLLNLLSNALKFTQAGKIIIKTKLIDGALIQIEIEDSGCGISEKNLKTIFNRFNQNDIFNFLNNQPINKENAVDVGLGLTIANNLATGLGGNRKLQVESKENIGTKFSFWIVNHQTNKIGCKFIKKNIFSQEIVKWLSISDYSQPQQQQQYLHVQNESCKLNSHSINGLTNSGMPQSNMNISIRSKLKNDESSYYLQNNKYPNPLQSLIKFNNEINQSYLQNHSLINNQNLNQNKDQNTIFSNNMSQIEVTKNKKFQLSFRDQSQPSEDQGSIFESNLFPQSYGLMKARTMDQNSKLQILENNNNYKRCDSFVSVRQRNETGTQENHHELDYQQQHMQYQKQKSQNSPLKQYKLNKISDLSVNNAFQNLERKNMQNNIGQLHPNISKSPQKIQSKVISPNVIQPQQSIFSNLSHQNEKHIIFNKCISITTQSSQSHSDNANKQGKNPLIYKVPDHKQQSDIQQQLNDYKEEQCNIINLNESQKIQIPNQFQFNKVSEKRNNSKSIQKQTSNDSQENTNQKNDVSVRIKFKDNNMNEIYQTQVVQNQTLNNQINFCSDSITQIHSSAKEYSSSFNKTQEEVKQNDLIDKNSVKKIEIKQNQINLMQKDSNEDKNQKKQNSASISPNSQSIKQKNELLNNKNPQKVDIIKLKINSLNQIPQTSSPSPSPSPISGVKQKILSYNSQRKCQCSNILIVDDNDFNIYALETRLKSYGFNIDRATSGFIALENVKKKLEGEQNCCKFYTLIFMDIEMPQKNGYETTQDILSYYKEKKIVKPPPISACTAFIQQSEQDKAKQYGMNYYITKPVNQLMLEEVLMSVIFDHKNQK